MDNKKLKEQERKYNYKILFTTIFVLLALIVVYFVFLSNSSGEKITYDKFVELLNEDKIESVELRNNTIEIVYDNKNTAWFYNRDSIESNVIQLIENKWNAQITGGASQSETSPMLITDTTSTVSILSILYPLLLIASVVFMIVFISRQVKGANGKSFDFVKNRARISNSKIKFDDVAGAKEEKEEVAEIVEFLKNPQKFTNAGARIPKGVLLVGAPGTGKTLLAKAIAGEADVPFFTISGSDFMELFVGVGASRVRDLFETAKAAKPCIVFIDEIDAVGRQRGTGMGGGNDEREQTLNQLLVQMDGFEPNEGIIVIAATNRVDILDPALLRPGRFDRRIHIHVPDVKAREEILQVHSKNKKFNNDVNLKQIARITNGFTGADLENLLNESAIMAARADRCEISMKDIAEGLDKVIMGPQKKSWIITDADKKITAFHESGHAIVGKLTDNGEPIHEVSIIPRGGAAGYTISMPEKDDNHISKSKLKDMITMLLAGRIAEELFLNDVSTGASNDLERATSIARRMVTEWGMSPEIGLMNLGSSEELFLGRDYQARNNFSENKATVIDNEIKKILDDCANNARKLLNKSSQIVNNMVEVLLTKETIYTDEVDMLLKGMSSNDVINEIENKAKNNVQTQIVLGRDTTETSSVDDIKSESTNNSQGNSIPNDSPSVKKSSSHTSTKKTSTKATTKKDSSRSSVSKSKEVKNSTKNDNSNK